MGLEAPHLAEFALGVHVWATTTLSDVKVGDGLSVATLAAHLHVAMWPNTKGAARLVGLGGLHAPLTQPPTQGVSANTKVGRRNPNRDALVHQRQSETNGGAAAVFASNAHAADELPYPGPTHSRLTSQFRDRAALVQIHCRDFGCPALAGTEAGDVAFVPPCFT